MKWIKCLWYSCVDAYYFGLKKDCGWVNKLVFKDKDKFLPIGELKWYFCTQDEYAEGPFDSYRICIRELKRYCDCITKDQDSQNCLERKA